MSLTCDAPDLLGPPGRDRSPLASLLATRLNAITLLLANGLSQVTAGCSSPHDDGDSSFQSAAKTITAPSMWSLALHRCSFWVRFGLVVGEDLIWVLVPFVVGDPIVEQVSYLGMGCWR